MLDLESFHLILLDFMSFLTFPFLIDDVIHQTSVVLDDACWFVMFLVNLDMISLHIGLQVNLFITFDLPALIQPWRTMNLLMQNFDRR